RKGFFVLHRIVAMNGNEVTLLGDGNLTPEHCHRDDIRATVIGFYRKGRQTLDRTDGRKWRWYSWWWMLLRPIRRYLLFIYRHLFV
ncbi:MAG: peptidase S41, partial [Prevotella sp.]|nr:peptidase S41 [Prevotella sp.]